MDNSLSILVSVFFTMTAGAAVYYTTEYFLKKYGLIKSADLPLSEGLDQSRLCERHIWMKMKVLTPERLTEDTTVCQNCGYLPNWDQMVSMEIVNKAKSRIETEKLKEEHKDGFMMKEIASMQQIFGTMNEDQLAKLLKVYNMGQTSQERFIFYQFQVVEEQNKVENASSNQNT